MQMNPKRPQQSQLSRQFTYPEFVDFSDTAEVVMETAAFSGVMATSLSAEGEYLLF